MNPAYRQVRFQAELPHGALPESFGIVTAWNPDGIDASPAANATAHAELQSILTTEGLLHFPVTGGSPDFAHAEPGFGIVASAAACLTLGRRFRQEAIFRIHRGQVQLIPCGTAPPESIGAWQDLAEGAAAKPAFHFHGNLSLLTHSPQPFLMSSRCTPDLVLASYAWAREQCNAGSTVVSGFHSPVEKDVFEILSRRGANLILVPGRHLPQIHPLPWQELLQQNRLLIASPFDYGKPSRPTRSSCLRRNEWIQELPAWLLPR